jgi:protein TonB
MKWALGLSVALHVALVALIEDRPGGASSLSGIRALEARIEPQPPHDGVAATSPEGVDATAAPEAPHREPASLAPAAPTPSQPGSRDAIAATAVAVRAQPAAAVPMPGAEMPFVRDPTYYAMAALDTPPRLLESAQPCYPQGAVGEVAYQIAINEHGTVDEASVVSVQPQGLFTGAAAELCGRLKFAPATKDGRAVRSRVRLVVGQPAS